MHGEYEENGLVREFKELIEFLEHDVKKGTREVPLRNDVLIESWGKVVIELKHILEYYSEYNLVGLAEVALGIPKWLDYYDSDYLLNKNKKKIKKLDNLLNKIIKSSLKIISFKNQNVYKKCGLHEDGACIEGPLGNRYTSSISTHNGSCSKIEVKDAQCFSKKPKCKVVEAGTVLYRIYDNQNNKFGQWWMMTLPNNITEWWREYAVLSMWNKDSNIITIRLTKSLYVWYGPASSQRVSYEKGIILFFITPHSVTTTSSTDLSLKGER